MAKVLYLPGLLGSTLATPRGPLQIPAVVYFDPLTLALGGWGYLDLAADGVSPGPLAGGRTVLPAGIFAPAYGPMCWYLQAQGYDVLPLGYDWRLSVLESGRRLWPVVRAWTAGQPFAVCAHSMGGLIARAIYVQMQQVVEQAQMQRLVTIGSPHYGSWEALNVYWRLPPIYTLILRGAGWTDLIPGVDVAGWLDRVMASMPAWAELMPWRDSGPLHQFYPDQSSAIYDIAYYAHANPYLTQQTLTAAAAAQGALAASWPVGQTITVVGTGQQTGGNLIDALPPATRPYYEYTSLGDGIVTEAQASLPGCPAPLIYGPHLWQPLDPGVWQQLPGWLFGSMPS